MFNLPAEMNKYPRQLEQKNHPTTDPVSDRGRQRLAF